MSQLKPKQAGDKHMSCLLKVARIFLRCSLDFVENQPAGLIGLLIFRSNLMTLEGTLL